MTNIYEKTKIIYDEKLKEFGVMDISNIQDWETIDTSKDLDTAIKMKMAFCRGYCIGYHNKAKELKQEKE